MLTPEHYSILKRLADMHMMDYVVMWDKAYMSELYELPEVNQPKRLTDRGQCTPPV